MIRRLRAFMHAWISFSFSFFLYIYFPFSSFFSYLMCVVNSLTHTPICELDRPTDHLLQWSMAHFYGLWRCTHTHIHIYGIRRMVKESIRVIVIVLRKRRKSIRIVKDKYRKKSYLRNCVKVLLNGTSLSSSERNEMRECVCPRLLYIIHPNSITVILCINVWGDLLSLTRSSTHFLGVPLFPSSSICVSVCASAHACVCMCVFVENQ